MQPPLSEELRPNTLSDFFGQTHAFGEKTLLSTLLQGKKPLSILLWGPPGCGKTTLAKIYARTFGAETLFFHPASHGLADLKKWIQQIQATPLFHPTNILFIDEIHRLNKAQQDALLPFMEDGTFTLIGATTENPSFSLNNALLSRLRVIPLKSLEDSALSQILEKAIKKKNITNISQDGKDYLIKESKGDARHLLNCIENILSCKEHPVLGKTELASLSSLKQPLYDKAGEEHYNLISALHKAIRASDPDASLYWFSRMLKGGEDPNYIARRLLRIATEDIGLADPEAQKITLTAWQSYERLGSPEGDLALAEAVIFLSLAPKSNASYIAFKKATQAAIDSSHLPPPPSALNAPTAFMKSMGYGKDYIYDHDAEGGFSAQNHFPEELDRISFYDPKEIGFERELKKRQDFFSKKRKG